MIRFILLRHGQSQWNLENRFTGWTDVPLTDQGRQEALDAARLIKQAGFPVDLAFTSPLQRSIETLEILLKTLGISSTPVQHSWRWNERHYGCLQGLNKAETARRLGPALVWSWRRGYDAHPPALEMDDHRHPRFDPLYRDLPIVTLPRTESLAETEQRVLPKWSLDILPAIRSGANVLIVAHGNSLRALVRYLDAISPSEVPKLVIPTGIPLIYEANDSESGVDDFELKRYYLYPNNPH